MTTLIARFTFIIVTLVALAGIVFLVLFIHTADEVQAAANTALQVAAITNDTSNIEEAAINSIETNLPTQTNGEMLFGSADVTAIPINHNQDIQVSVTYHMPVLGALEHLFGIGPTIPITRTTTQALDYQHNGLHAILATSSPAPVQIQDVIVHSSGNNLTFTINGEGFGLAPAGVPGTTMGSFFTFQDLTQGWKAGSTLSGLAITYSDWNNSQIVITGIENYGRGTEVIQPGDNCEITVTSPSGSTTYFFVANPSGTTQYSATLTASATNVATTTPVSLTASTSVPGNGTEGIGIYDESTGAYLNWSGNGTTVSELVNHGNPTAQDYVAYYGQQGQIEQAIAISNHVGVTWTNGNVQSVTADMYQDGSQYYIAVYGEGLSGATISGTGLSNSSQVSGNQIQAEASDASDTNGVVTLADGTQIPFDATATY